MPDSSTAAVDELSAGIRISRIAIYGFRCLDDILLDLEPGTTYLVGENNSGKTSILLALWSALGSRRPLDDDLHRTSDGTPAEEASVDVWVVPADGERFSTDLTQRLVNVQRDPSKGSDIVGIRTVFRPSQEGSLLSTRRSFLQPDNDGRWAAVKTPLLRPALMSHLEAHLLHASRDLVEELGNRTSVWGRVLADLQIEQCPEQGEGRGDLESALVDIARRVREASPVLSALEADLAGIVEAQASVGKVELQPVPPRLEELARTAEVVLHQGGQTILPLRLQGLGSRSLATILVFKTLAKFRLGADSGFQPQIVTLLEEPEAHLHPQAISALQALLDRLPGQRIVSTHSPQLVAHAYPSSVRILRRSAGSIRVLGLPPKTAKRVAQFRRYVERPFGEVLFARAIVLCDGSTERCVLPVLLSGYFGFHPASLGVSFIDCESMNREQTNIIIKAADDLDLRWLIFADNDDAGQLALNNICHPKTDKKLVPGDEEVVMSGKKQIEQLLIDSGYSDEIEQVARDNGKEIRSDEKLHLGFLKDNKSWAAEQVSKLVLKAKKDLPGPIVELGKKLELVLDHTGHTTNGMERQ